MDQNEGWRTMCSKNFSGVRKGKNQDFWQKCLKISQKSGKQSQHPKIRKISPCLTPVILSKEPYFVVWIFAALRSPNKSLTLSTNQVTRWLGAFKGVQRDLWPRAPRSYRFVGTFKKSRRKKWTQRRNERSLDFKDVHFFNFRWRFINI